MNAVTSFFELSSRSKHSVSDLDYSETATGTDYTAGTSPPTTVDGQYEGRSGKSCRVDVANSLAKEWILDCLQREAVLERAASSAMRAIQEQILASLPSPELIRRHIPIEVTFRVGWNLQAFIISQGYSEPAHAVLAKIITLTGSTTDAQAMTAESFLAQTWPSTGTHFLKAIQNLLMRSQESYTCTY